MKNSYDKKLFNWFYNNINQVMKLTNVSYNINNNEIFYVPKKEDLTDWNSLIYIKLKPEKFKDAVFNSSINGQAFFQYYKTDKKFIDNIILEENKIIITTNLPNDDPNNDSPIIDTNELKLDKEDFLLNKKLWEDFAISKETDDSILLSEEILEAIKVNDFPIISVNKDLQKVFISNSIKTALEKSNSPYIKIDRKFLIKFPKKAKVFISAQKNKSYQLISFKVDTPHAFFIQTFKLI
jgi:hypothetical protein